jgi:16S rRNA (cytidine1402-2'-O)-methyltransferase
MSKCRTMSEDQDAAPGAQLYVVATPIGNLEDVTLRALRILKNADVVAAEDTRVTARLLEHHGIARRAVPLHRHNETMMAEKVLGWLGEGKRVALVSDAGTPGISDPGAIVVARVRGAGYRVTPVPGASALAAALSASGLDERSVLFCGFLPSAREARRKAIAALAAEPHALVFYEAPHRVVESVEDLAAILGERRIVMARELTKLFESVHESPLQSAAEWLKADANRTRGEFVLMLSAPPPAQASNDWEPALQALLAELPLAQAVRLTCAITGARRKPVYERALSLHKPEPL